MKRTVGLLFLVVMSMAAQQFEVASVRPSEPDGIRGWDGGPGRKDPTRYSFGQATMLDFISTAWNIKGFQILSPMALDRDKFDLAAKVPVGATKEEFRVMLQNLLKERFGLKMHMESREFSAYALVVAKSGLKLKEAVATTGDEVTRPTPGEACQWPEFAPGVPNIASRMSLNGAYQLACMKVQLQPISVLANFPLTQDGVPVVDQTGLTGKYNFTLGYTIELPGGTPNAPPVMPAVFTALQQQLGLQLVSKKLPFDVVVVEAFNRTPTEN